MSPRPTNRRKTDDDDYEEIYGQPKATKIGGRQVEWHRLRAMMAHFMPGIGDPFELTIDEFFCMSSQIPDIIGLERPTLSL